MELLRRDDLWKTEFSNGKSSKQESSDRTYDLFIAFKVFASRITKVHASAFFLQRISWHAGGIDAWLFFGASTKKTRVLWISNVFFFFSQNYTVTQMRFGVCFYFIFTFYSISTAIFNILKKKKYIVPSQIEPWCWIWFCYCSSIF